MAGELSNSVAFNFTKNASNLQRSVNGTVTVTGDIFQAGVQTIGTTDETISKGDIGTIGFVYVKNLDATNFVIFGSDGTLYPLKLKPGEFALFRFNAAAFHAKADTAACKVEYAFIED